MCESCGGDHSEIGFGGPEDLLKFLKSKLGQAKKFKHLAFLEKEEAAEFNELEAESAHIDKLRAKYVAKRMIFNTKLQLKYDACDKNLQINKEQASLEVEE